MLQEEPSRRIDSAFRMVLSRDPNSKERERLGKYIDAQLTTAGENAAWVAAGRVLMNTR